MLIFKKYMSSFTSFRPLSFCAFNLSSSCLFIHSILAHLPFKYNLLKSTTIPTGLQEWCIKLGCRFSSANLVLIYFRLNNLIFILMLYFLLKWWDWTMNSFSSNRKLLASIKDIISGSDKDSWPTKCLQRSREGIVMRSAAGRWYMAG